MTIPKFRAWDKQAKKMKNVEAINLSNQQVVLSEKALLEMGGMWSVCDMPTSLDDVILMQSTGLVDKNGVEIFEGDLLSCDGGMPHIVKFGQWICEDDLGYKIRNIGFYIDSSYDNTEWLQGIDYENTPTKFEIVGNIWDDCDWSTVRAKIYENPELEEGNA